MRPVDSGSAVFVSPPPPPPPPPAAHTVASGETVGSIAHDYGSTPQAIAQANYIAADARLTPGQRLTIPAPAAQPASTLRHDAPASAAAPTPQQNVDSAIKNYEDTLKNGENGAVVNHARQQVYTAVHAEIQASIAKRNTGVPGQFQTPANQLTKEFGAAIEQRYSGDATAQSVLTDAVADSQLQAKAEALIPTWTSNATAQQKLQDLGVSLQGQPQAVIDRVIADPRVQGWVKDAAAAVAAPYAGKTGQAASIDTLAAQQASQVLADTVKGLPPALATQIVQASLPTIAQIGAADGNYASAAPFTNLSKVVDALGDSPQAQALTQQIAQSFRREYDTWSGRFDDPHGSYIKSAVGAGASPKLALELARELKADGKTEDAGVVLRATEAGVEDANRTLQGDLAHYQDLTKDLSWLINQVGPGLTPEQLQKAINQYAQSKGQGWQDDVKAAQDKLIADAGVLKTDIAALTSLPTDMQQLAPDALAALKSNVADSDTTQKAIEFASSRNPGLFEGAEGDKLFSFFAESAHKGKDFTAAAAQSYIAGHVLAPLGDLNPSDAASVAKATQALDAFRLNGAQLLGIPQNEVDAGVAKLKQIVQTLRTTTSTGTAISGLKDLGEVQKELGELKDMSFSSGAAGVAFRTLGVAIAGGAFLNSANATLSDPSAKNVIGTLAFSAGLAKDSTSFASTIGLIDSESGAGQWASGASIAGRFTERFIGTLNVVYFALDAGKNINSGNVAGAVFDGAAAFGSGLAAIAGTDFAASLGIGAWGGPVGAGIALVATGLLFAAEYGHDIREKSELAKQFLAGAGVNGEAAEALSSDAAQEAKSLQSKLSLSPEQVQQLAESHPELFSHGAGATQAAIDVAAACGIQGDAAVPFFDAVAKDNPNYLSQFQAQNANGGYAAQPLSYQANLVSMIQQQFPNAAAVAAQHSPALFGADAGARRQADRNFETLPMRDAPSIGGLLKGHSNPAYQAEIVKILKDNGTLDAFVRSAGSNYHYNGIPEAARSAIQAAQSAGVLSASEAQAYLAKIG